MKSCSNDDWGPDLRFMGVKLMEEVLILTKNDIVGKTPNSKQINIFRF